MRVPKKSTPNFDDNFILFFYNTDAGRDTLYNRVTELTFKCHVMAPVAMPPQGGFLLQ